MLASDDIATYSQFLVELYDLLSTMAHDGVTSDVAGKSLLYPSSSSGSSSFKLGASFVSSDDLVLCYDLHLNFSWPSTWMSSENSEISGSL